MANKVNNVSFGWHTSVENWRNINDFLKKSEKY